MKQAPGGRSPPPGLSGKGGVPLNQLPASLQAGLAVLRQLPADHPDFFAWYTLILRFLFPVLAIVMLVRIIRSLVKAAPRPEV